MIRALLEEALLFLLPFALFTVYLLVRRRNPLARASWSIGQVSWLVVAGLVCVVVVLVATGLMAERQTGAFQPPHMENGRLIPGQFR